MGDRRVGSLLPPLLRRGCRWADTEGMSPARAPMMLAAAADLLGQRNPDAVPALDGLLATGAHRDILDWAFLSTSTEPPYPNWSAPTDNQRWAEVSLIVLLANRPAALGRPEFRQSMTVNDAIRTMRVIGPGRANLDDCLDPLRATPHGWAYLAAGVSPAEVEATAHTWDALRALAGLRDVPMPPLVVGERFIPATGLALAG